MEMKDAIKRDYLFKLSIPIFLELLLQLLVGNIDQIMVGQYAEFSVGAIANSNQILNLILIAFNLICMATTILISLYKGSGNEEQVTQIYTVSLVTNFSISLILSVIFFFFSMNMVSWLSIPAELVVETNGYIKIVGSFLFLQGIYLTFSAILKSNTLMKESLAVSIVVNLVNILGNGVLIFGMFGLPAFGVLGAAISSNISRVVGIVMMYVIFRKKLDMKFEIDHIRPFPTHLLKRLLKIGLPAGAESFSYSFGQLNIQKMVNMIGNVAISTKAYVAIFANLSYVYTIAISQASQIVVGYIIGNRDYDTADQKVMDTLKISVCISVVVSTIIWYFSDNLFLIFTENEEVILLGHTILFIDIFLEIGRAFNIVLVRALQTAGDGIYPTIICIIFAWLIGVGLGYILAVHMEMGLAGIWIAMALDECVRGVIFFVRWKSGKWKSKNLIQA